MVFPRFQWVDKSQCRYENEQGQIQNPTQADCAQAVSAVKAIAIAQAEGQRIYTINHSNAATALPKLPVGGTVGQEIQSAIQAGKEVTFHERGINAHGFSGYGYIITDPDTGGGAYLIEGKANGGWLALANQYLHLYGNNAWEKIRADRLAIQNASGRLDQTYREAEHFLYALIYMSKEEGWLVTAIATEGYWVTKAISNLLLQDASPWRGSPVSWEQLIAGLYGNYCATFGCVGVRNP